MPRSTLYEYSQVVKIPGLTGLVNPKSLCYQISVIQCLFASSEFSNFIVSKCVDSCGGTEYAEITHELAKLCKRMRECSETHLKLDEFKGTFQRFWRAFTSAEEQDAEEFLILLLESLHVSLKTNQGVEHVDNLSGADLPSLVVSAWNARTQSAISEMFFPQIIFKVSCKNGECNYTAVSSRIEKHLSVLVGSSTCPLNNLLKEAYKSIETIPESKCSQCGIGQLQQQFSLGRLPPVLIIHLKRFRATTHGYVKNEGVVYCPHDMDLEEFIIAKNLQSTTRYELFAVVNHSGSLSAGHYITIRKEGHRWFECNDAVISGTSIRKINGSGAYVLFYKRVRRASKGHPFDVPVTYSTPWQAVVPTPASRNVIMPSVHQIGPKTFTTSATPVHTKRGTDSSETSGNVTKRVRQKEGTCINDERTLDSSAACEGEQPAPSSYDANNDLIHIVLTPDDVPGAALDLDKISDYLVPQLQRWLKCRGLVQTGSRQILCKRILAHVRMGKADKIDPKVDNGKWYDRKMSTYRSNIDNARTVIPILPVGQNVWKAFPSADIPSGFSRDQVEAYVKNLPAWTFSYSRGVEMVTQGQKSPTPESASENAGYFTDEEHVDPCRDEETTEDYFTRLVTKGVSKCIDRGRKFYRSGRILSVWDTEKGYFYFVKAQVQASMEAQVYLVTVTIRQDTGRIVDTSCTCKARALKRCGHVAGVLVFIVDHVEQHGYDAVTCTGKLAYWVKRSAGKNPGVVKEKGQYYAHMKMERRAFYDPKGRRFHSAKSPVEKAELMCTKLEPMSPTLCWVLHLRHVDRVEEEVDDAFTERVANECSKFLWELNQCRLDHYSTFEVPGTAGQGTSSLWKRERGVRCTASCTKRILGLSCLDSKRTFLRNHMWGLDLYVSAAMQYGIDHEPIARADYTSRIQDEDPTASVEERGLMVNPRWPQLACSPDGIVRTEKYGTMLLEIKVMTEKSIHPEDFETELPKRKRYSFYLFRNAAGKVDLKRTHPYYYQIQTSLAVLELRTCHLFVWSESGHTTIPVVFDEAFWHEKCLRLLTIHRQLFVPEYVMKRTPKKLLPIEMTYPYFHESEEDPYFC